MYRRSKVRPPSPPSTLIVTVWLRLTGRYCPTQYDELGCWFLTSHGVGWPGSFQDCEANGQDIPGVVNGQTYTPVSLTRIIVHPIGIHPTGLIVTPFEAVR